MPSILATWGALHGMATLRLDGPLGVMFDEEELDRLCDAALRMIRRALAGKSDGRGVPARGRK
jgi:hypothetical protein